MGTSFIGKPVLGRDSIDPRKEYEETTVITSAIYADNISKLNQHHNTTLDKFKVEMSLSQCCQCWIFLWGNECVLMKVGIV